MMKKMRGKKRSNLLRGIRHGHGFEQVSPFHIVNDAPDLVLGLLATSNGILQEARHEEEGAFLRDGPGNFVDRLLQLGQFLGVDAGIGHVGVNERDLEHFFDQVLPAF